MTHRLALTLGLVAAAAIWGFTFVAVQDAVRQYSVFSFLTLRFVLAALALLPVSLRRMGRRELARGAPAGLLLGLGMLLQTVGLQTTTATSSGLITGLYVVFAPLLALLLFRAYAGLRLWLAVGLSVLGLVLVTGGQPSGLVAGDALTLVAALSFGAQIALLSRLSPGADSLGLTLAQLLAAIAIYLPAVILTGAQLLPSRAVEWWAIIVTGLGASAYGFWIQTYAQQRLSAARVAVILATEPVFAAIAGYILAGDRLTAVQWSGAGLMLLALFVAELSPYLSAARRGRLAPALAIEEG